MKKVFTLLALFFALSLNAEIDTYCPLPPLTCSINYFGAANWAHVNGFDTDVDTKIGYLVGVGLAAELACCSRWLTYTRIEAEYSFRQNRLKEMSIATMDIDLQGSVSTNCWMLDIYQGIPIYNCYFLPFFGFGAGYSYRNTLKEVQVFSDVQDQTRGFAWQVIAGLTTQVNVAILLSLEYRYFNSPRNLHQQSVGLSVRYLY